MSISTVRRQSLNRHCSVLLDQTPFQHDREGITEREDGEMDRGGRLFEEGDYSQYFRPREAIIRGRRLNEGRTFFEEIRYFVNCRSAVRAADLTRNPDSSN